MIATRVRRSVWMSLGALLATSGLGTGVHAQKLHLRLVQEKTGRERNDLVVEVNVSRTSQPLPIGRDGPNYVAQSQGHDLIYIAWIGHAPKHYWSDFVVSKSCKYDGNLGTEISVAAIREIGYTVGD